MILQQFIMFLTLTNLLADLELALLDGTRQSNAIKQVYWHLCIFNKNQFY